MASGRRLPELILARLGSIVADTSSKDEHYQRKAFQEPSGADPRLSGSFFARFFATLTQQSFKSIQGACQL
jgi:hypothetical protein